MGARLAEEKDRAEADSRDKETRYLSLSRSLQVNSKQTTRFLLPSNANS